MPDTLIAVVSGGSMYPLLHNGDQIVVLKNQPFTLGDVVLCDADGFMRTHRVIKIKGRKIWTKGDNVPHCDEAIDVEKVIGPVKFVWKAQSDHLIDMTALKGRWKVLWYARLELCLIRIFNLFSKRERKHEVKQKLQSIYYRHVVKEFNYEQ